MSIFVAFWFQILLIMCIFVFGLALLGGGIGAVVAVLSLFWPMVCLSGILAYFNAALALERIGAEVNQRLQKQ